jgi:uncharacterized membrane protein
MSEAPTQVILAAFKDEHGADAALEQLRSAQKQHLIGIDNVAVLRCDAEGKVHIKEPTDMSTGKGAAIGGLVGGVAGLLFGPIGLAAAGGAALGGAIAHRDTGFKDKRLEQLGRSLPPGTSAILAVIEHKWVTELEAEMAEAGAEVVTSELAADIAEQLRSGHSVAYTAVATEDAMVVARATDEKPTQAEKQPQLEGQKPAEGTKPAESTKPAEAGTPTSNPSPPASST